MKKTRTIKINIFFIIGIVFLFALIILKLAYVGLSDKIDGINLRAFAMGRNTAVKEIVAKRGTIYDVKGEILAQDVNSYTVIAHLNESRTTNPNKPKHVVDKEYTAKMLSPIINMTEEKILSLLNYNKKQVELGPGGRGLTELVKEEIEDLDLPGIDFVSSVKRYYPNADFLSYTLGYAKTEENGNIIGEFGLEKYYNDILTGKNGYRKYQQDSHGYKIVNTDSEIVDAESGDDIYLTIDTNIQMFAEQAITSLEESGITWASVNVANAKTGEILGLASSPSFNPNKKDIKTYYDPFVSYVYEPGSTMKIFSFMAAIENGLYDGSETYKSGNIVIDDNSIKDWNNKGWGTITFDEGFMVSSNVSAVKLAQKLGRQKLLDFYTSLGFGETTKMTLPNELKGTVNFKYNLDIASASFGQAMSITPVEMIQALTSLANDGKTIKPYLVKKIVNHSTEEILYEGKREELTKVASTSTIDKVKDLMRGVIDGRSSIATGKGYYIEGYDIIGKTGTAQISTGSGYVKDSSTYVRSFAGLFPGDDPEVIVYVAASKLGSSSDLAKIVKVLIEDTATYLNIYDKAKGENKYNYKIESYINKKTESISTSLSDKNLKLVILGDGDKIIKQYPSEGTIIGSGEKLFLLTNSTNYKYPNLKNWSRLDVSNLSNLINLNVEYEGYGFVTAMNFKTNSEIDITKTLKVTLKPKYNISKGIDDE